jgi:ribosomal protein S18 acetylase RimI-like enzyme
MELRTLDASDLDAVISTFHRAFADYIVTLQLSRDDLLHMMTRRGADLSVSSGAFDGDTMVAVMVVAVETFESVVSAYDVFTGVVPEARGHGLARKLFGASMPAVRARGAERFVLEVIEQNEPAVHSYRKAGFVERRRLRVFAFDDLAPAPTGIDVQDTDLESAFALIPVRSAEPSWQNSDASIRRVVGDVVALRAVERGRTVGVALCVPRNRDVPQLHVERGRADVVHALLASASARNLTPGPLRVVNVDARASWLCEALAGLATEEYPSQFEMVRSLASEDD